MIAKNKLTFKTQSPLHIGTGELRSHNKPSVKDEKTTISVQEIAKDYQGNPYVPATQIKGAIRAIAEKLISEEMRLSLFGFQGTTLKEDGNADGEGGKLIFENAYLTGTCTVKTSEHVTINPCTGAAKSHHLFFMDYVPENTEFTSHIVILDQDKLSESEQNAYNKIITYLKDNGIVLGGNTTNGYGLCSVNGDKTKHDISSFTFNITLNFSTPFLVNDPSKVKPKSTRQEGDPTAIYKSKDGKVILPASSFRGALSHQFQRIARTKASEIQSKLFGYTDYKALLSFTDFISEKPVATHQEIEQDFIAVDRFTGGTKEGAKFKIKAAVNPVLKGKIILDTNRFKGDDEAELSLLLLTLRDLIEGDITFGYGSSKGYGVCMAEITLENENQMGIYSQAIKNFLDIKDKVA